ncbi:hypothetical protein K1719_011756 [Acacia pycnantha]|nr:hypothetical protein K1719_011756 [Acacia pycnantha]
MDLLAPDKEENTEHDASDCASRVRIVDAPILLFVCFHEALRGELNELRSLAETSSPSPVNASGYPELILQLQRRFQFLKLVLKYHCVVEDEVIFPALDVHVKNVICTYSLEHDGIDDAFNSIFQYLDELMDPNENISKPFQELICCIGILQATTFQHMQKEEEQVFPLLLQKVSIEEQASLVWQFICGVPIMLLQEILPWMLSFLSADKQAEVQKFLNEITPMEKELQEVLIAWLGSNSQIFTEDRSLNEVVQCADGFLHMKRPPGLSYCNKNFKAISNKMKENCSGVEDRANQVNVLYLWHNAIKKDMKELLEELHQIRNNTCFHNLDSLLNQLKFFADVLIFYSNAQKKFFYPVLSELANGWLTKSSEQFLGESHIEDLQRLLLYNAESDIPLSEFVEKLCRELELFMTRINKQFAFQETEVFPVIHLNRNNGMLEELISLSLHMMPLRLLKCVITWFSGHLSENESRSILSAIKQGNLFVHEAFASIVHGWFRVGYSVSSFETDTWEQRMLTHHQLCRKLQEMCKSMHKILSDHMNREEIEIWHLIREFFSNKEQMKIVGCMLGRIRAEILQDMIPWLMTSLTPEEQHVLMFLWSMVAKNTMFDEWLAEWWDGYRIEKEVESSNDPPIQTVDPLEIISKYLSKEVLDELQDESTSNKSEFSSRRDHIGDNNKQSNICNRRGKSRVCKADKISSECSECRNQLSDNNKQTFTNVTDITRSINDKGQSFQSCENSGHYDHVMKISPDDLEMAIRRVSRDSSLDLQKKSYIIQNLLMSRWIVKQHISCLEGTVTNNGQEFPGQHPSYRDSLKLIYGCKHYRRSCKLLASCCNQLYTCIHCHNDATDHSIDRKSITKMMCMKCLKIQPISATCSTVSCGNLPMAKYYCWICRLFDDEREIYHCPYCNLCRVGKGLGLDYFHCMNCNACMSRSLKVHICREKSLEDNCPICHEYIFTSCSPVKALPCGHVMHSTCFQEYTYFNYTCPVCCKSLGDMQVYFRMLDALLAEEKIPDEHLGQTQMILCNDCEKKGTAPFHWLYHKCSSCGSYNTRVI